MVELLRKPRTPSVRRTKQERQNADDQVKVVLATYFALSEQAREKFEQMQAVFRKDVYTTVQLHLETCRNLEDKFEETTDSLEAERLAIEEELKRSDVSKEKELEEHKNALASKQAAYELLKSQQTQQEELLHRLSAEKDQLQCQQDELLTAKVEASKTLQKLVNENQALQEQIHRYEQEIKERLLTLAERSEQCDQIRQENKVLQEKYNELAERHSKSLAELFAEEVNLQDSFEELCGDGTIPGGHVEQVCIQDITQAAAHAAIGNSEAKLEQQLFKYRRLYNNVARAYNSMLGNRLTPALQELVPNTVHLRAARKKDQLGKKTSRAPDVVTRVKSRERPWKNTRARATVSERDPHDDFLDTPRDLAALNAVNHSDDMFQANEVPSEGVQSSLDGRSKNMPVLRQQLSGGSLKVSSKPADLLERNVAIGQDTKNDGEAPQLVTDRIGSSKPQMRSDAPNRRNVMSKEDSHLEARPSINTAAGNARKKTFSLAGFPFKYVEPVRKKRDREALPGTECRQCKKFYDAVLAADPDGVTASRCEHHDAVSRHRYRYAPPPTPDGFWNIGFDSDL